MQSFITFCGSFSVYIVGTDTKTGTWDGIFAMLGLRVASNILSTWFDLAETYIWVFLWGWEFNTIIVSSNRSLNYYGSLIVVKRLNS